MTVHLSIAEPCNQFGKLLTDLGRCECRYAVSEDEDGRHLFCSAVTDGDAPYCPLHQSIAWRVVPKSRGCAFPLINIAPALPSREGTARNFQQSSFAYIPRANLGRRFDNATVRLKPIEIPKQEPAIDAASGETISSPDKILFARASALYPLPPSFKPSQMSKAFAAKLAHVFDPPEPMPSYPRTRTIQKIVCAEFNIPLGIFLSPRRNAFICRARHIAMFLARNLTVHSCGELGRRFGGRDHTTLLHGFRKIERLAKEDADLAALLKSLEAKILQTVEQQDNEVASPAALCAENG